MSAERDLPGDGRHRKGALVVRGNRNRAGYVHPPRGGGCDGINQSKDIPAQPVGQDFDVRADCYGRNVDGRKYLAGVCFACRLVRNAMALREFFDLEWPSLYLPRRAKAAHTLTGCPLGSSLKLRTALA